MRTPGALPLSCVVPMRAVVQRVKEASVVVEDETLAAIGAGIVVLLGVRRDDTEQDAKYLASKIAHLRIFEDADAKMNLSVKDVGGDALVVSQFTLLGDCRKGRRPSFIDAAEPQATSDLYERFTEMLRHEGVRVETGRFRAMMDVKLTNCGPVTLILDSKKDH